MIKTGWYIQFYDRESVIVYAEHTARTIVTGAYDARSFAPGRVVKVERIVTEWFGSHDDNTRGFRELSRIEVPLESLGGKIG